MISLQKHHHFVDMKGPSYTALTPVQRTKLKLRVDIREATTIALRGCIAISSACLESILLQLMRNKGSLWPSPSMCQPTVAGLGVSFRYLVLQFSTLKHMPELTLVICQVSPSAPSPILLQCFVYVLRMRVLTTQTPCCDFEV